MCTCDAVPCLVAVPCSITCLASCQSATNPSTDNAHNCTEDYGVHGRSKPVAEAHITALGNHSTKDCLSPLRCGRRQCFVCANRTLHSSCYFGEKTLLLNGFPSKSCHCSPILKHNSSSTSQLWLSTCNMLSNQQQPSFSSTTVADLLRYS